MIYKLCIVAVIVICFLFRRLCSVPFYKMVNRKDAKQIVADKSLIKVPDIVSCILFFERKGIVTYYSLIYQTIWYILTVR